MRKFLLVFAAIVASVLASSYVTPAFALTRTWVSGVGTDSGTCTRTVPCLTFAFALTQTAAGGEINCLDSGGFGSVTITTSLAIKCDNVEAGVLVGGGNGIVVNAGASDNVLLEGLDIEGNGVGVNGVNITGGGSVVIRWSTIRRFTGSGVNLVGTANAKVMVEDSIIALNGVGVFVQGAVGATNIAVINRSTIDTHTTAAAQIAGPGGIFVSGSQLVGIGPKLAISGGGTITSYGNNVIRGAGVPPTSTLPLQ